jgi:hypothetical protein
MQPARAHPPRNGLRVFRNRRSRFRRSLRKPRARRSARVRSSPLPARSSSGICSVVSRGCSPETHSVQDHADRASCLRCVPGSNGGVGPGHRSGTANKRGRDTRRRLGAESRGTGFQRRTGAFNSGQRVGGHSTRPPRQACWHVRLRSSGSATLRSMPTPLGDSTNAVRLRINAVRLKESWEHARLAFHFTAPPGAAFSTIKGTG